MPRPGPTASRPDVPGYGIPKVRRGLLPWSHAVERLEAAREYWVTTADRDGRPHAVPVWGAWVEDVLLFGGGPTRWARNLAANPEVVVHLESGVDVVIVEGRVTRTTDDDPLSEAAQDAYEAKYQFRHPPPFWVLRPRVAFAWTDFPKDATRWRFDQI
jgi:Pyridoxamine 5'-phosphate oxidase